MFCALVIEHVSVAHPGLGVGKSKGTSCTGRTEGGWVAERSFRAGLLKSKRKLPCLFHAFIIESAQLRDGRGYKRLKGFLAQP